EEIGAGDDGIRGEDIIQGSVELEPPADSSTPQGEIGIETGGEAREAEQTAAREETAPEEGGEPVETPEAPQEVSGEEGLDLDIASREDMEEATEPMAVTDARAPEDAGEEFKAGMEEQLTREDAATHYELGVEYMEMELYREASREFKVALKEPSLEFACYRSLGHCHMKEASPDEAIIYFLKALKTGVDSEEERMDVMYELALAYEAAGSVEESRVILGSIHGTTPGYRDVGARLRGVSDDMPAPPGPPRVTLDDGLIEVELL
ncbi:MAG TPA: tetratricopeptide repeat protein, partial [Thermodesulfobacteriota bacterium]|nr:tetratricopeptide repeat protein [Thermodesulfobacteriota bacterium]